AEDGDMIIAAQNYSSHFGRLKELSQGDIIVFSDLYGQVYEYCVKEMSTLDGTAVSDMKSGEWDLTLFTCTKGGKQRVTIRCEALNSLQ
ncbi:MAG: sortase, partial [Firmicutes bacterium]|nr:sortase [Bacillota bacterium]MBR6798843.1 sortase [Bacillota bacterium]